ncbi:hypothetical protein [Rhodopseudomonas sp. B29]|uniref:hypothetical protein n=1 Tax=Rhodopseudomonas sp. B29 TaxID=95607 RepID=UPI0003B71A4E|nr:hypothetical protein [Rhodopseudomonas sp. B29]
MQDLDAIMDSRPEGSDVEQEQMTREDGRDELGRFAARQAEQPGGQQQPDQQQQADPGQQQQDKPPPGFIPQQAFDARMAKAEEKWSGEVNNLRSQLDQAMRQLAQYQPQQQPSAPKKPFAEALFEDPEAAFSARLQEAISPITQNQGQIVENFSRMMAIDKFGEETVQKAYTDLSSRMRSNPAATQATYQRIMQSPHPFGELVRWHKEQSALQTYGDDPEAWRTAERERIKAELLAEMQGGQQQQTTPQQQQPERLPNSFAAARNNGPRGVPAFAGPLPLSEIMGGR